MPDICDRVDILEDQIPREFLEMLLVDRTTGKNILWATDIGGHNEHDSIHVEDIVGENGLVLRPRVRKSDEEKRILKSVCHIISWNFWQMDGLTACPPYTKPSIKLNALVAAINKPKIRDLFGNIIPLEIPSEYCKLMDWDENKVTTYVEVYASAIKDRSHEC